MIHKLQKAENPYEQIDRNTIQLISNPIALAIWIYLQSKPNDWNVNENEIREHFSIGRDRYLSAMKELRELGLYEYKTVKKDGKFVAKDFHLYASPKVRKTELTENHTDIKEYKNINKKINKKVNKKLPQQKPKDFQYPSDFTAIWNTYRLGDKWAAYKAFLKRSKDYSLMELQIAMDMENKKEFGKRHFSTVLNGDIDELINSNNGTTKNKGKRYV